MGDMARYREILLTTYYLLLTTCYLILATCYLLLATCYLLLATCCLLLTAYHRVEEDGERGVLGQQ